MPEYVLEKQLGDVAAIAVQNEKIVILDMNRSFGELMRIDWQYFQQNKGQLCFEMAEADRKTLVEQLLSVNDKRNAVAGNRITFRVRDGQGEWRWLEAKAVAETDDNSGQQYLLSVWDIGEYKKLEESQRTGAQQQMWQGEQRDRLTGLLVQSAFAEEISRRRRKLPEGKVAVVAHMDISGFAYVNENFGTEAGNQLLKTLTKMIRVENNEKIVVSRIFTDFFAGYLEVESRERAEAFLHQIEKRFAMKAKKYYPSSSMHLSMGLYVWDDATVEAEVAIENASFARKKAKKMGVGRLEIYDSGMREKRNHDMQVAGEFHRVLQEGGIEVYLQPKFDLATMKVYGAEALSRWHTGKGTMKSPVEFIPPLEQIGYVMDLDFFVYETVLKHLAKWKSQGRPLKTISVNFSKKHFELEGISERISRLAHEYGIEPEYIEIELTESLLSNRPGFVVQEMEKLRREGFRVAIDDFGTGYSSLSMLLEIPANTVKIDKSFLNSIDMGENKRFISLVAELVKCTNEDLICEGVETAEQVEFLKECGFKYGQGFICDKPIEIREFEEKYM